MNEAISAEIIAVGTEILLGEITDTNSVHIARRLRDIGINLYYMTSVGDNEGRIADAIRLALSRSDVVITCGGLGPTVDDMTRQGVARATGRELVFHQYLLDQIAQRFESYRVPMTENNRRQAYLPDGAEVIENPVGTAPCFIVESDSGGIVISLPGVPREMKYLMAERVIPYLLAKYPLSVIKARILKVAGIGESMLDDMIGPALLEQSNPTIGLAAHHGAIDVRITAKAPAVAEADAMLDAMDARLMAIIGDYVYGRDNDHLEQIVAEHLRAADVRLVVVEAGINAVNRSMARVVPPDDKLVTTFQFDHPDALLAELPPHTQHETLRDLAFRASAHYLMQTGARAAIVVISDPTVGESSDRAGDHTVAAVTNGQQQRSRIYGFGSQYDLARDWVSRWSLANLWRLLKEDDQNVV